MGSRQIPPVYASMASPSSPTSAPPRKRGRRNAAAQSGREALLASALLFFAKKGFEGASLREIATEAGVDMALVARLFGSKAMLWQAVIENLAANLIELGQLLSNIQQANPSPAAAMSELIELFSHVSVKMPEFVAFYIQESMNPGERLDMLNQKLIDPFLSLCEPIVETARAAGIVQGASTHTVLKMLFASISIPLISPGFDKTDTTRLERLRADLAHTATLTFIHAR